jgi:hypothetical protein
MVLYHVTDRADSIIEAASSFNAECLCHGNLHTIHIMAVPDRLQERIGEAKEQQIVDRLFPEVMVDTKDLWLGKHRAERVV